MFVLRGLDVGTYPASFYQCSSGLLLDEVEDRYIYVVWMVKLKKQLPTVNCLCTAKVI